MIAARVSQIAPSRILDLLAAGEALKRQGVDLVDLGPGQPDFPVHPSIVSAVHTAMERGCTTYGPVAGLPELREALAKRYLRRYGAAYTAKNILVSAGAKGALYHLLGALVNPGDEVLLPLPYFASYPEQVKVWGGVPRYYQCSEEQGFRHSAEGLQGAIGPATKGIILNSPANPTGAVIPEGLLSETLAIASKHGLFVIMDECYDRFVYPPCRYATIPTIVKEPDERLFVVGSFSKTFSMMGFRVGYAAGGEGAISGAVRLQAHSVTHVPTFIQHGALEALEREDEIFQPIMDEFSRRREIMLEGLSGLPGTGVQRGEGAFYAFPGVLPAIERLGFASSEELAASLLDRARLLVIPGSAFGTEGHIRLSYAVPEEHLQEGLRRLVAFIR